MSTFPVSKFAQPFITLSFSLRLLNSLGCDGVNRCAPSACVVEQAGTIFWCAIQRVHVSGASLGCLTVFHKLGLGLFRVDVMFCLASVALALSVCLRKLGRAMALRMPTITITISSTR